MAAIENETITDEAVLPRLQYKPLNKETREIRLLTLLHPENGSCACGSSSTSDGPVRVRLEHFSLDDYSKEFALDYQEFSATINAYMGTSFAPELGPINQIFTSHLTKRLWFTERGLDTSGELLQLPDIGYSLDRGDQAGSARAPDDNDSAHITIAEQVGPLDDFDPSKHGRFAWGDFIALSYTWGDMTDTRRIIVNDCIVNATKNLEAALRAFCCRKEYRAGVKLWVDALCINQDDLEERSVQVARMADIYPLAINVNVWLEGMQDIKNLSIVNTIMRTLPKHQLALLPYSIRADRENRLLFSRAFFEFIELPYWRRTWILQELVSSPWWTTFICKSESFTWRAIFDLYYIFRTASPTTLVDDLESSGLHAKGMEFAKTLKKIQDLLQRVKHAFYPGRDVAGEDQLSRSLAIIRYSLVSDDRDRVYAMLGIIPQEIASRIVPDYTLDVEAVYRDFSQVIAESKGSLDILFSNCLQHEIQETPALPSWVIDLREPGDLGLAIWSRDYTIYRGSIPPVRILKDQGLLECKGFRVDVVDGVGHSNFGEGVNFHLPSHPESKYTDEGSLKKALLRILFDDPTYEPDAKATWFDIPWFEGQQPDAAVMEELSSQNWADIVRDPRVAQFQQYRLALRDWNLWGRTFESLFPHEITKRADDHQLSWKVRALITCESGRLGAGTRHVQHGDLIYVIPGCRLPVLLRPEEHRYQVVGLAFVDGLMLGEGMEALNSGEYVMEDLQIC